MDAADCNRCLDTGGVSLRHQHLSLVWKSEKFFRCSCPAGEERTDLDPRPSMTEFKGLHYWLP